ncbi:MAG: insulinase family protein [Vibrionaceae bacterium]
MLLFSWLRYLVLTLALLAINSFFTISYAESTRYTNNGEPLWSQTLLHGQLKNGLRYVAYPSAQKSDPFNLRLIVQAGAVDEEGRSGIAHAVEHMVFRETQAHPQTVHRYLMQLGWKTGLQVNAVTGLTHTQYMIRTRPNDALNLDGAMALLSELALRANFEESSWQSEQQIILAEMHQGEGVAGRINAQKRAVTRNGSRYAQRSTIGTQRDVTAINISELRQFYERHYRPANMLLVASGHIDKQELVQAIERHFNKVDSAAPTARPYLNLPLKAQLYISKIQDPKGTSSRVTQGMRTTQASRDTLLGKKQHLENFFLRRLLRDHVRRRAAALPNAIASSSIVLDEPTPERLTLAISANTHDYDKGLQFILQEQAYLRKYGLDASLLDELKKQAHSQIDSYPKRLAARNFAQWEDKITEGLLHSGPIEESEIYQMRTREWLDALTITSLNLRLFALLDAQDRFIYYQVPGDKSFTLPDEKAITAQQLSANHNELPPLPARSAASAISTNTPKKAASPTPVLPLQKASITTHIAKPQADPQQPALRWQLSNGDEIIWLDRSTQSGKVLVRAQSQGGHDNLRYASFDSQTAVQVWQQSGFNFWSAQQNQAYFSDKNQPHWTWSLKSDHLDLAAMASPDKLEALLSQYAHFLQSGQIAEHVLSEVRPQVGSARQKEPSAQARAWQNLQMTATEGAATDNTINFVSLTNAAPLNEIARAHLFAPTRFYLLGNIEQAQLEALIKTYLAPIKRQAALTSIPAPTFSKSKQTFLNEPQLASARVRMQTRKAMQWTPEQAFILSSLNPIAQEALKEELRLNRSAVYSARFEMKLDHTNDQLISDLSFECLPERAQELQNAALNTLSGLSNRLNETRLARLKKDIAFAEQLRLQDDNTWLHRMILSHQAYGDLRYLTSMQNLTQQMKLSDLKALASTIFAAPNTITLISGPAPQTTLE